MPSSKITQVVASNDSINSVQVSKLLAAIVANQEVDRNLIILGFTALQSTNNQLIHKVQLKNTEISNLTHNLSLVQEEVNFLARAETARAARRASKSKKTRKASRDAANQDHLIMAINLVEKSSSRPKTKGLLILSFFLLYVFGLRISNLLILKNQHLTEILEYFFGNGKVVKLPLIKCKRSSTKYLAYYPSKDLGKIITKHLPIIELLRAGSPLDPLFSTPSQSSSPLNRSYLTRKVNKILARVGAIYDLNLQSHSFRIGYITSYYLAGDLALAMRMANHSHMSTTQGYIRTTYTSAQLKESSLLAESYRATSLKI